MVHGLFATKKIQFRHFCAYLPSAILQTALRTRIPVVFSLPATKKYVRLLADE